MNTSRETTWTTGMRSADPNSVADANLPSDETSALAGYSGYIPCLDGYVRHHANGITSEINALVDDGIHDAHFYSNESRHGDLGNIHNHGITTALDTLARKTYSCHRINDNIDGLHGFGCLDGDVKEPGDVFEGGWLTYAIPALVVGGIAFVIVKALHKK